MPTVHIDKVESLNAEEVLGVIRKLTRKIRVEFTKAEIAANRDPGVLIAALNALNTNNLGPFHTIGDIKKATDRFGPLVCKSRSPAVAENDPCWVDVIMTYEHVMEGNLQKCVNPAGGFIFAKGKTSIVDKSTNFFYPEGDRTKEKTLIQVAHRFPATETGITASPLSRDYPRTVFQGGEINTPYPQGNVKFQGLVATSNPHQFARSIVARINSLPFMGEAALKWLCSEVEWEVNEPAGGGPIGNLQIGRPNYRMSFEFQFNDDTWDPTVVFNDSRTGRPPANVLEANFFDENGVNRLVVNFDDDGILQPGLPITRPAGLWQVPALARLDFNAFFGLTEPNSIL